MEKPKEERQTTPQTTKPKQDLEKKETQPKTTNPPKELEKETQANTSKPKDLEEQHKSTNQKELEKQPKATNMFPKELEAPKTTKPKEYLEKKKELPTKRVVWDCESTLYDSFELKSFEKQLDSAIISSSRTLSMPHLSDHHRKPPPPLLATTSHHHDQKPMSTNKPSKFSRSIHKLLRSVFRPKQNKNNTIATNNSGSNSWFRVEKGSREGVYYVYDTSGALTTIPEGPETVGRDFDGLSPDLKSFVKRTASDRFAPASLGISCA